MLFIGKIGKKELRFRGCFDIISTQAVTATERRLPSKKQEETSWTTETVPAPYRAEVSMSTSAKRLKAFPPEKLNIELL